jgi:hypothetical protein
MGFMKTIHDALLSSTLNFAWVRRLVPHHEWLKTDKSYVGFRRRLEVRRGHFAER